MTIARARCVADVFDQLAATYDAVWTESSIGRHQRNAVWRRIDPLFRPGDCVLDLGCGTGRDALRLMSRGVAVQAFDASAEMVRVALSKGVNARQLALEDLHTLSGLFDGAISNFGPLNCVGDLDSVARALGSLIRLGGHLTIVLAGPICAWETVHFLKRAEFAKAFRRASTANYKGIPVTYPTVARLTGTFAPDFTLAGWYGIGLWVPPSYVEDLSETAVTRLAAVDRRIAHWPMLRSLADHRLLVFQRV
jgi:SAM-dependent methyltransferase